MDNKDCLNCKQSFSQSSDDKDNPTGFDRLFCQHRQEFVDDNYYCENHNEGYIHIEWRSDK